MSTFEFDLKAPIGTRDFADEFSFAMLALFEKLEEKYGKEAVHDHLSLISAARINAGEGQGTRAVLGLGRGVNLIGSMASFVRQMALSRPALPVELGIHAVTQQIVAQALGITDTHIVMNHSHP